MFRFVSILSVFLTLNFAAIAEETSTSRAQIDKPTSSVLPEGWAPFIGLSSGYMSPGGETRTEGIPTNAKILGSHYGSNFVTDIGAGLQVQSMNHDSDSTNPLIEAAARYRLTESLSLGPVLNTYLGQSSRYNSANDNVTSFVGAQIINDFGLSGYMVRAGLTAMTDLDVKGAQVNTIQANVHFGFGNSDSKVSEKLAQNEVVIEPAPAATHLIRAAGDMSWDKPVSHFALNSSVLSPAGKSYLTKLAPVLKSEQTNIAKISVVGHTDSTGTEKINKTLSIERAKSVTAFLKSRGVDTSKFELAGRAALEPVSKDMSLNRRSELKIQGKAELSSLEQKIKAIK